MLVVDASCLYEVVTSTARAEAIRDRMSADDDQLAPHVVDVEVFGIIRRHHLQGLLDGTAASQAVDDLRDWPGQRVSHRPLLERAWALRASVRGWDAMYVALAEASGAVLLTLDERLTAAAGPTCRFELVG
jgi:predicted nucleic acid-binding protein